MGIAPSGSRRRQRRDWGRANISARPGEGSGPRVPGTGSGGQRRGCCDPAPAAARLGSARLGSAASGQPQGSRWPGEPSAALLRSGPAGHGSGWCGAPCPASRPAWDGSDTRRDSLLEGQSGDCARLRTRASLASSAKCWWGNERHLKWSQKRKPPKPWVSEVAGGLMLKCTLLSHVTSVESLQPQIDS